VSYAKYVLYVSFAGAMAAMCSSSDAGAQSIIAPRKCVSAVIVQAVLGYNVRFHNNCEYAVTVYWGQRLGNGGGIIQYSIEIQPWTTTDGKSNVSDIAEMIYHSCPFFNYKLTYKKNPGTSVTLYNGNDALVCLQLG
jgi:hypothetical protein